MTDALDIHSLCTLAHAAGQLWNRWLPWDTGGAAASLSPPPLADLAQRDWRAVVAAVARSGEIPWFDRFLARRDPGGTRLANAVAQHLQAVLAAGAAYVLATDPRYPELLARTVEAPAALTVLGTPPGVGAPWHGPAAAVVGSRKASVHAVRESFALGRALASDGITVVSGGAFGCDAAAHHGVLAARVPGAAAPAPAICVFAGGLSALYPRGNAGLFRSLRGAGAALVSERLWHAPAFARDFPARNRIIAGLSGAVAVMQAGERSGAVVTARLALEEGRDVLLLAHPENDQRALGSARLAGDGAPLFADGLALAAALTPLAHAAAAASTDGH